ncbi:MAG TPA: dTMP kinase [Anaeromyxobacteraceae bacterium]|nr:dTMP kinase [Anaeromyxobacteraceae bacterium]
MSARRGRFIVLEGLDGAGTTTQARLLGERLRAAGRQAHVTAEPSGGPVGALVRQVLQKRVTGGRTPGFDPHALALLFAADRLDHVAAEVAPRLAEGCDVVSDRYTLSSLAYQALTTGDAAWVAAINGRALAPDLTVFLRVRAGLALGRRRAAATAPELYEVEAFQRRVARSYERAIATLRRQGQRVEVLDGEAPVEAVADGIARLVSGLRRR